MDRINGANTVDIGGGRRGFRSEDLVNGLAGTEVTHLFMNSTQEEIMKVIEEAGLVPSSADWTQLWQALQRLGLNDGSRARRWMAVISMTLSSAPGAPSPGDAYLVPSGATGIWAAQVGTIAEWTGAAWAYVTPPDGHGIALPDGRVFERVAGVYVEKVALDAQSGKWSYAVAAGTANAITASLTPAPAALSVGMTVKLLITATNTTAITFNLNGLGAKPVRLDGTASVRPGDLVAGTVATLTYDGTNWQLTPTEGSVRNSAASTGGTTVTLTTGSGNFTVPADVYALDLELVAPGGGGGYAAAGGAGAGGNGGNAVAGRMTVTPGQIIAWSIGTSGVGGNAGTQAQPGGDASFGAWLAKGGTAPPNVGAVAGSAVSVATGDVGPNVSRGQQAEAGFIIAGSQQWGGHGGQSSAGGFGGNGARNGGTSGNGGSAPGGGGGGGSNTSNGGDGGAGRIVIRY